MSSYLLTWNPRTWDWTDLSADLEMSQTGQPVNVTWRCHNKSPTPGDRAFLLRQGVEPRGIMASGVMLSAARELDGSRQVDVRLDVLLDPATEGVLPLDQLQEGALAEVHWGTQSSGIVIPEPAATQLLKRWNDFTARTRHLFTAPEVFPDEISEPKYLIEGATQAVVVNRYERDPAARRRCIEHYGPRCVICGLNFEERYGAAMAGFIHVHHVTPLSEIGRAYRVDPIGDLRPVCPNCHAVIHSRSPALSIEEAKELIATATGQ